mgnify:CR=1 FL=1
MSYLYKMLLALNFFIDIFGKFCYNIIKVLRWKGVGRYEVIQPSCCSYYNHNFNCAHIGTMPLKSGVCCRYSYYIYIHHAVYVYHSRNCRLDV